MEVVDRIRWIPGFGYERELDWLLNMRDWMISKKRYYGLALPIYECAACGHFEVIAGREALRERAVEGWEEFEGHSPHRPWVDAVRIRCQSCGEIASRIPDVGNPWLDAGIVPFSTMHYRTDRGYWEQWFPADFITESFPGQFRNWFYALLAMSTVLRREEPFRAILGYALLVDEQGRPMHKSWGNAIDFDDVAEQIGVDVMRWMFARQRSEENMRFGFGAADAARRELLVLWNVFAFFVTYARLSGWRPGESGGSGKSGGSDNSGKSAALTVLDRWIASRTAGAAADVRRSFEEYDTRSAADRLAVHVEELSTWYLRRSRLRFSQNDDAADRTAAFGTLHRVLAATAQVLAPVLPFMAEEIYRALVPAVDESAPDSVHLTRWPDALESARDEGLEAQMAIVRRAVELGRTLRSRAGIRIRQPLARAWLAVPSAAFEGAEDATRAALLELVRDELNVRAVELIDDQSELVERRVKPLLPLIGKRLGSRIPAVMAAARANQVEYLPDGSVSLAGVTLAPNELEILASPRSGTEIAEDNGVVVAIDTTIDASLRAEGDARELQRALQELRKQAELALDDRIEVWLSATDGLLGPLEPHLESIAARTLATAVHREPPPDGLPSVEVELEGGTARLALRRAPKSS
jgi:isoleucyl-tRNA synthetase